VDIVLDIARWLIAVLAGLIYLLCSIGNWSLLLGAALGRIGSFSLVLPFLGPVFGLIMILAAPVHGLLQYWWLIVLIEPTWLIALWSFVVVPLISRDEVR
jgi:hypothetical protein